MEVGTGIFLGLSSIALVWLFAVTRDRWRWKRIALWSAATFVLPAVAFATWLLLDDYRLSQPRVQREYEGLAIGEAQADVKFKKGEPSRVEDGFWLYDPGSTSPLLIVGWHEGRVRFVMSHGENVSFSAVQSIGRGDSQETIVARFGKPDHVSTSADGLSRWLSFAKYGVAFQLERNSVISAGVYDSSLKPMAYAKAASDPEAAKQP